MVNTLALNACAMLHSVAAYAIGGSPWNESLHLAS